MAFFTAIATAISSAVSTFFTVAGLTSLALRAAVGIGVSMLAQALQGKAETPAFSIQGKLNTGDDTPRSFPLGYTATAGSLVYSNEWGKEGKTKNAYHVEVIALSDLPIDNLAGVLINGETVTLDTVEHEEFGFPVIEYRGDGENIRDFCWVKFYDGTQTAADAYLVDRFGEAEGRTYESTRVGVGIAYVIVTCRIEDTMFTGFPQFKFAVNGIKLYDPSKDTSRGGNGTQRLSNRATWKVSHNPGVHAYNLFLGITFQGKWVYGLQNLPPARLPVEAWIAQIRKCDVSNASTGNQPIYRAGGEIQINAPVSDAVSELMTTCQGRISETGGFYKPHLGVYDPSVFGISDDDILSTEEQSFTPFFGLADTVNGVIGKYPAPKEAWNLKSAPPIYRPDYEAEDGNRRLMTEITLTFLPYPSQVQRVLLAAIKEARRARRLTFVLGPEFYGVEAGDVLLHTSERNGFLQKRFRVDGAVDKANLDTIVDVTEIDPSDYDYDHDVDYRVPVDGEIKRIAPVAIPMSGWTVSKSEVTDANGLKRRPAILVEAARDMDDVRSVRVQVRVAATQVIVFDSDQYAYTDPWAWKISDAILPATAYEVRGMFLPFSPRPYDWGGWLPVTTDDIRFSAEDFHLLEVTKAVQDELVELDTWIWGEAAVRKAIDEVQAVSVSLSEQDLANFADKQTLRREVTSTTGALKASLEEQITVTTSATSALAKQVVTVQATLGGKADASVVTTTIARVDATEAGFTSLSGQITAINAALPGKASAEALSTTIARVEQTEQGITTLSGRVDTFTTSLNGKASSQALEGVASAVSQQGETLTAHGERLSQITTTLDGKASTTALTSLGATVSEQGGTITAQGNFLASLSAQVGEVSADARLRFEVINSNGTGYSTIGLQARFGSAEDYRSAGMFVKVPSDPNLPSQVIFNANLIAFSAGNDENGTQVLFADATGLYIPSAFFREISVQKINFEDGTKLVTALPQNAVHLITTAADITAVTVTSVFQGVANRDVSKTDADVIQVNADIRARATALVGGKATLLVELWEDNGMVKDQALDFTDVANSKSASFYYLRPSGSGTFNYKIVVKKSASGEDFQIGRRTVAAAVFKKAS